MKEFSLGKIRLGGHRPLALIAGPCVIEGLQLTLEIAAELKRISARLRLPVVFKASYDKANRSSLQAYRGVGLKKGLEILARVREDTGLPVISDIHCREEVEPAARVLDALQIPAFLCRQTDLLLAAGKTGLPVNVKKGQFLAPEDMKEVVHKLASTGNEKILLTERGTFFGYHNLVVDFRSLVVMGRLGYPVFFDATHSVQTPGEHGSCSGGHREFIPGLARAAAAVGVDGLYLEVHPEPEKSPCDGSNIFPLGKLAQLLSEVIAINTITRSETTLRLPRSKARGTLRVDAKASKRMKE